uniref:WIF domain-containing protein n=1 Tax=Timema monikensis TaxID=170555 RepID=A0A7R9ECN9_9NEOP|nr:unnamed protein product [Timema monikensis]
MDQEGQINQWLLDDSDKDLNISLDEDDSEDSDVEQPANNEHDSNSEMSGDNIGLNAELFYVRDGVVNDYALNFSVPVPAHISELYFIWQSLTGMPLPYVVKLRVSDNEALVAPLLNISHTGHIPVVAEAFMVSLSCNKAVDAEVDVILNLNISLNKLANNITTLTFRRKKICLKGKKTVLGKDHQGQGQHGAHSSLQSTFGLLFTVKLPHGVTCSAETELGWILAERMPMSAESKHPRSSTSFFLRNDPNLCEQLQQFWEQEEFVSFPCTDEESGDSRHVVVVDSESPPANTIYIAVGSACVLIVIIVVGMAAYYVHNSKAHHQQADALQESRNGSTGNALAHTTFLKVHSSLPNNMIGTSASSCASYASFKRLPSYNMLDDKASQELHERIVELTIPRSSVQLHRVVLEGTFGRVYHGSYIQGKDGPEEQVLVKTVTEVEEGVGNQIDLCWDRELNPSLPTQKFDTLPLECQVTSPAHKIEYYKPLVSPSRLHPKMLKSALPSRSLVVSLLEVVECGVRGQVTRSSSLASTRAGHQLNAGEFNPVRYSTQGGPKTCGRARWIATRLPVLAILRGVDSSESDKLIPSFHVWQALTEQTWGLALRLSASSTTTHVTHSPPLTLAKRRIIQYQKDNK